MIAHPGLPGCGLRQGAGLDRTELTFSRHALLALKLVAHAIFPVGTFIWEQAQDRISAARNVAIVPAGNDFDALADCEAVEFLHGGSRGTQGQVLRAISASSQA